MLNNNDEKTIAKYISLEEKCKYIFFYLSCYINHSGVKCKYETNEGDLLPDFCFLVITRNGNNIRNYIYPSNKVQYRMSISDRKMMFDVRTDPSIYFVQRTRDI